MKPYVTTLVILFCLIGFATAQEKPAGEPKELIDGRNEYLQAVERVSLPYLASYLAKLEILKQKFTKEGKMEAALAVDTELKQIQLEKTSEQLVIVSAKYGLLGTRKVSDVTEVLHGALASGEPTIKLSSFQGAFGYDPAPGSEKKTKITFYRNRLKKELTFSGDVTINFFQDLK